jgi:type II secretory pathway component PulJ
MKMTKSQFSNMNYKKSFTLLEILFVIFIGSLFFASTSIFTKNLYETNQENEKMAILKLDLNSAKIIIEKNIQLAKTNLTFKNNNLYLDGNLLLEKVTNCTIKQNSQYLYVDFTIDNSITQSWVFKL